jgi:MFS superfamily sulfate permease-like transporter
MTTISNLSLQYFLPEYLDSVAVSAIRGHAALHPSTSQIILDATRVAHFDPVGVLRLWDFCRERVTLGCEVQLVHLHPALHFRIRNHPLNHFVQEREQMFDDPFAELESRR